MQHGDNARQARALVLLRLYAAVTFFNVINKYQDNPNKKQARRRLLTKYVTNQIRY
jgi:hypothetical protein